MKRIAVVLLFFGFVFGLSAWAQTPAKTGTPSAQTNSGEEVLTVQSQLPAAEVELTRWAVERKVYKELYKKELKDQGRESVQE